MKFFQTFLISEKTLNLTLNISNYPRERSCRAGEKKNYFHVFYSILHRSELFQIFLLGVTLLNS